MDSDDELMLNMFKNMNDSGSSVSAVRTAILNRNLELLEELHNLGADLNEMEPDGLRPLHVAAKAGEEDALVFLLRHGADIDASSSLNETALYIAVNELRVNVVQRLLQFEPDVNNEGNIKALYTAVHARRMLKRHPVTLGDKTLLYEPVRLRYHDRQWFTAWGKDWKSKQKLIFEALLEHGFNYELEKGCDPKFFHGAVELGFMEIVKNLLKYGADASMELGGETPLLVAIKTNQPDITDQLLLYEADVNAQDGYGKTPIYYAAKTGNVKLFKVLLTRGATISDYPDIVHAAISGNSAEIVEELLTGGTVDINDCTVGGIKALPASLGQFDQEDVTALLLDKGADVNERSGFFQSTPLHLASAHRDHRNCETMLKKGAAVDSKNNIGHTPLHVALTAETVKILLQFGADINAQDLKGRSPLHYASIEGKDNVMEALLKAGADIDATDEKGKTALHLCFKYCQDSLVRLLLDYGADINICDKKNRIPCSYWIYRDEDNCLDEESWKLLRIFVFHIITMQASNGYVSEEILNGARKARSWLNMPEKNLITARRNYEEEIRKLLAKKIQNSNISFYECLTKNISSLAMLLNNEHVVQGLQSDDVNAKEFPGFAPVLKAKFGKAMERKALVEQGCEMFEVLTCELLQFPACCAEAIMLYLSNQDLRMLIAAFQATSQYPTETESMTFKDHDELSDSSQSYWDSSFCSADYDS